uniref:Uncharacterized protein n=1 Tax=Compsopogon caeruleus TaxID=31354 RepID=A0A6T6BNQ7_9RHOD|mmetsp:Transcript_14162/g.28979  ORF Transcript_14162/g.28979 Transcript_14162/m.28979 type:complete len:776 (+) Transcript_14162:109-2436(+)|eukprot:CAMPEP_0184689452 /NCGR_PEP_ID=MMETSP0312-20130426/30662_1 /TAXON_ID=31354 /ORGANISM="Compsopogon coeruleus, Strain SAG 36.94" /LENGTH=775 /DNA_ID=CAMNT_0027146797 /DNA_START=26 /DNA_END=2356 /DNA_ORIENTATION=-
MTPRVMIKGGVWKNSEDEMLKASVMKYGKNQWARISSLLGRKSAKQCKSRWYEWLDPSIKKTEWTREEEEKLLHLAKLMPTQWRTIAPIIGRTATQCLEHYEKLLDEAARDDKQTDDGGGGEVGEAGSTTAARQLRPGEIDPHPETRPARPDPVDMDEDEKEMLSEARARLANTKGKKAKRKAREKQLEEAKRLTQIQKRRELHAAGIPIRGFGRVKGGIDYAKEIPFFKEPAPGVHDTEEEDARMRSEKVVMSKDRARDVGRMLQSFDGKSRDQKEAEQRKLDARRRKAFEEKNLPEALKPATQAQPPIKRARLHLPAPMVSDQELEAIAKDTESVSQLVKEGVASGSKGVADFVPDYGAVTPRTWTPNSSAPQTPSRGLAFKESWEERRRRELENLRIFQDTETPLMGGTNIQLHESDFSGVTPRRKISQTPNPISSLVSPARGHWITPQGLNSQQGLAPSIPPSPLSINSGAPSLKFSREERLRMVELREQLKKGLDLLPSPKNTYKISLDFDSMNAAIYEGEDSNVFEPDAEEAIDRERKQWKTRVETMRAESASLVSKRGLTLPASISDSSEAGHPGSLVNLVEQEIVGLARVDSDLEVILRTEDQEDKIVERIAETLNRHRPDRPQFDIVEGVYESLKNFEASQVTQKFTKLDRAEPLHGLMWSPSARKFITRNDDETLFDNATRISLTNMLETLFFLRKRSRKLETNLSLLTGGQKERHQKLSERMLQAYADWLQTSAEVHAARESEKNEAVECQRRLDEARRGVTAS